MMSINLLNKLYKTFKPNTFIPAVKKSEIIIGATSKFIVEHVALSCEIMLYNTGFGLFACTFLSASSGYPSFILFCLMTLPVPYCLPAYRTYKAIVNEKLKIMNFNK